MVRFRGSAPPVRGSPLCSGIFHLWRYRPLDRIRHSTVASLNGMDRLLALLLVVVGFCIAHRPAVENGFYLASDGNYYQSAPNNAQPQDNSVYSTTAEPATTKAPANRFNQAGWETDDNGNVYVGDDNAKMYLISVGSYWPFPKDYRKKREAGIPTLEELLGSSRL